MLKKYAHKSEEESEESEGNWLVSYADLMTLLWGFFVILAAFSTPDAAKFEKLKKKTAESMGGVYENPFNTLTDELKTLFEKENIKHMQVEVTTNGLIITSDSAYFFDSASAQVHPEAMKTLHKISELLLASKKPVLIHIEGHTDDLPINNKYFSSNWDLSLRRALEVLKLFETNGIDHNSLRPLGLADVEPVVSTSLLKGKSLEEARARNRRIVIRLTNILPKIGNQSPGK